MKLKWCERLKDWGVPFVIIKGNVDHVVSWKGTKGQTFCVEDRLWSVRVNLFDKVFELSRFNMIHRKYWEMIGQDFWHIDWLSRKTFE